MIKRKMILIGISIPIIISIITSILFAIGVFSTNNSKSIAALVILGGMTSGFIIFLLGLSKKLENYLIRKIEIFINKYID
jgi:hypothetical protein